MTLSDFLPKLHYPTRLEKLADGWVHGVGLGVFSLAVLVALGLGIWKGGLGMGAAIAIYAVGVITMIAISMAYNLMEDSKHKAILRRFDHAAIFLMIAASYTPFTTQRFDLPWAIGMTSVIWALALIGIAGKLFLSGIGKKAWIAFYCVMGWLAFAAIQLFIVDVPLPGVILLIVGGALYTLGVPFYVSERLPFRRAIWHGFVLVAAAVHYAAILAGVVFA
jgi:hemolysin III